MGHKSLALSQNLPALAGEVSDMPTSLLDHPQHEKTLGATRGPLYKRNLSGVGWR